MREYQFISPSLDGIIRHESIVYEGIRRPEEIMRFMDRKRPEASPLGSADRQALAQYFNDLYAVFMKKFSSFAIASQVSTDEGVKLSALLQEMIKVKILCGDGSPMPTITNMETIV